MDYGDVSDYTDLDIDIDQGDPDQAPSAVVDWPEQPVDLAEVLRDALDDAYEDAGPEEMDEALENALDSMSSAEAFNFAKALRQVEAGARQAVSDPMVSQIGRTALPIAGGALGTAIGGPVGTALGTRLGTTAAGALGGAARPTAAGVPQRTTPPPPVAGGSAAAAQGLVLSQQPDVLKALLALAMGQHGKPAVNGVPVPQIMGMLSSVFGQAAADADELMYLRDGGESASGESLGEDLPDGRSLYTTLLDVENDELAEAVGGS